MSNTLKADSHEEKVGLSVYVTQAEADKISRAAKKQRRTITSYIASVVIPQAEKDAK